MFTVDQLLKALVSTKHLHVYCYKMCVNWSPEVLISVCIFVLQVWAIFIGNLVHETVIAFCLGLQLVRVHNSYRPVVIAAVAYALMNPFGLFLTTAIFESVRTDPSIDLANGIFQALSSGCFIYVTFCEILEGQITHRTSFAKICSMFAGYATMAVFAAVPGSSSYSFVSSDAVANCSSFQLGN